MNLFRYFVGLLEQAVSPMWGLYLCSTAQHRKMCTYFHALNGIWTHDSSVWVVKTHALDQTGTKYKLKNNI